MLNISIALVFTLAALRVLLEEEIPDSENAGIYSPVGRRTSTHSNT
jgi:hypothetical protein